MRLVNADDVKEIICKYEKQLIQRKIIYEIEKLKSYSNENDKERIKTIIQDRIKMLKYGKDDYLVSDIIITYAVVTELEDLLREIEEGENE